MTNKYYFGAKEVKYIFRTISEKLKTKIYKTLIQPVNLYGLETWDRRRIETGTTFEKKLS